MPGPATSRHAQTAEFRTVTLDATRQSEKFAVPVQGKGPGQISFADGNSAVRTAGFRAREDGRLHRSVRGLVTSPGSSVVALESRFHGA